jgi:hypothetical protein
MPLTATPMISEAMVVVKSPRSAVAAHSAAVAATIAIATETASNAGS